MQVALERAVVFAGDVVRGKVYVHNATCDIDYNELYVEFSGEEYNWWQEVSKRFQRACLGGGLVVVRG
jgi:hypothetical protein